MSAPPAPELLPLPDRSRPRLWTTLALLPWLLLAAATSIKAYVQPHEHTVYPVFVICSEQWWDDVSIYAAGGYRYSPTFAIAHSPLAWCGYTGGAILFNLASITALVAAIRRLGLDVLPGPWTPFREGLLLSLSFVGSIRGIWSFQTNALVLALVFFAVCAILRKRWWTAAGLLAAPVFIKIWPLALVLLLIACWPKRLPARFAAVSLGLAAFPFFTRPPATVCWQYQEWFRFLTGPCQDRWGGYRDFWTIWEQFGPPDRTGYLAMQLAAAGALLAWTLWLRLRGVSEKRLVLAVLCGWVTWQLLFGPGTERLTYGLIAPLASWAMLASFSARRNRTLAVAAWLVTGLLGAGFVERALLPYFWAAEAVQPLGVVLFGVWIALHFHGGRAKNEMEQSNAAVPAMPQIERAAA